MYNTCFLSSYKIVTKILQKTLVVGEKDIFRLYNRFFEVTSYADSAKNTVGGGAEREGNIRITSKGKITIIAN